MNAGFFQEANGVKSSFRGVFVGGMVWCRLYISAMSIMMHWTPGEIIAVFSSMSAVFGGMKLGQKALEEKSNGET